MTSTACQKKLRATFAYYILTSMCLPSLSQAESFDRRTLYLADSGRIGDQFVRYTAATGSPCISIQLQIPGGKGRYSVRKDFCSFDGKSLIDDFSNVEFKRGEFQDDQLRFEIALTPLGTKEIEIKICQVNFKDGQPEELTCQLSYG